jgi:hypothetical protein
MMGRKEAILTMSGVVMKYLVSVQEPFFDRITGYSGLKTLKSFIAFLIL